MAKPLKQKQPESSIDRFLDKSLTQSLMEPADGPDEVVQQRPRRTQQPLRDIKPARVVAEIAPEPKRDFTQDEPQKQPAGLNERRSTAKAIVQEEVSAPPPVKRPAIEPTGEPAKTKRELVMTETTAKTFDELVNVLSTAIESDLTRSHVMRALMHSIKDALPGIATSAMALGPMKRPSNATGYEAERDRFELRLSQAISRGLKE